MYKVFVMSEKYCQCFRMYNILLRFYIMTSQKLVFFLRLDAIFCHLISISPTSFEVVLLFFR